MKFFWSLLLLTLGVIFLGAELNFWGYDKIRELWQFWPLIFIFAGLEIITKKIKYGWIIMLLTFFISGTFVYGVVFDVGNFIGLNLSYSQRENLTRDDILVKNRSGIGEQEVKIEVGASNLKVFDVTEELISGHSESNFAAPKIESSLEGDILKTKISMDSDKKYWFSPLNFKKNLSLSFNRILPLKLNIHTGASNIDIDLSQYILRGLDIETGASSINVIIGEKIENKSRIWLKSGVSSVKMKIPENVNIIVDHNLALSNINIPQNLEGNEKTIYLKVESALTSIEITRN